MTSVTPKTKVCGTCGVEKSATEYHKNKDGIGGLRSQCKVCKRLYHVEYGKVNKEKISKKSKDWRTNNLERERTQSALYYEANRAAIRAKHKKHYEGSPEQYLARSAKRRAIKAGATIEEFTLSDVLERWGTNCHICGEAVDLTAPRRVGLPGWGRGLHLEHVVPLAVGGNHSLENVKPAHGICNVQKGWRADGTKKTPC